MAYTVEEIFRSLLKESDKEALYNQSYITENIASAINRENHR